MKDIKKLSMNEMEMVNGGTDSASYSEADSSQSAEQISKILQDLRPDLNRQTIINRRRFGTGAVTRGSRRGSIA